MQQDGNKTHIRQFTIVLDTCAPHRRHHVATKEAELRISILPFQFLHQVRRMQVATGLSRYQVILH